MKEQGAANESEKEDIIMGAILEFNVRGHLGTDQGFEPFHLDLSDTIDKVCPTCGRWHSLEPGERVICDCGAVLVGEKERVLVEA